MSLDGFSLIGKYTLPTMSGSHSDFVAYLKHADFENGVLDLLDDGGGDIRFSSDEAGNNQLPCEVVEFDKTGSSIQIWVKIPTATTGTIIYIWGDNTGASQPVATDPYGRNAVWSDYWAAYHFTDLTDSSGNSNDLTVVGTPTNTAVDIIGEAYDFADGGDYLYTDSVFVSENESFLMSFYYKVEDINDLPLGGYVYSIADNTDAYDNYSIVLSRGGTVLYVELFDRNTSASTQRIFSFAPSNGDLFKIIAQQSSTGTDLTVIHNGVVYNDSTSTRHLQGSGFNRLSINRLMDRSPANGSGIWADEPRVGKNNVIRSQSFLLDEYNNQTAATSWGTMEFYSAPPSSFVDSSSTLSALNSTIHASQTIEIVDISSSIQLSATSGLLINSSVELVGISSSIDQLATGNLSSTINIDVNDISSNGLISSLASILASVDIEEVNISSSVNLQSSGGLYIEQAVNNDIQSNSSIYGNAIVNASIDIELKNIEISSQLQSASFLQSSVDIELNNIDSVISLIADSSETEFNVAIQQIRDSITINKIAIVRLAVEPSTVEIKPASGIIKLNNKSGIVKL